MIKNHLKLLEAERNICVLLAWVRQHWLKLTALTLLGITISSLVPLVQMQKIHVPFSDKTHHFVAYAALMFPVALRCPKYWWLIAFAFTGYSGLIELLQPLVNRSNEWLDLLANACGVAIGTVLGSILKIRLERLKVVQNEQ